MRKLSVTICLAIAALLINATVKNANATDKFYAFAVNELGSTWEAVLSINDKSVEITVGILECPDCNWLQTPKYLQCDKTQIGLKNDFKTWCTAGDFASLRISGNLKRAVLWGTNPVSLGPGSRSESSRAGDAVFHFIAVLETKLSSMVGKSDDRPKARYLSPNPGSSGLASSEQKCLPNAYELIFKGFKKADYVKIERSLVTLWGFKSYKLSYGGKRRNVYWYSSCIETARLNRNLNSLFDILEIKSHVSFSGNKFEIRKIRVR